MNSPSTHHRGLITVKKKRKGKLRGFFGLDFFKKKLQIFIFILSTSCISFYALHYGTAAS